MGNINLCRGTESRFNKQKKNAKAQQFSNKLVQEAELDQENVIIQLYSGYCAMDQSDVTVNISDEQISRCSNEQEVMLFSRAGDELKKETADYITKHKQLHHKLPFYTHAGDLSVSNVIHCTFSENKRIIGDSQIQQTFIECLQIADEELEASSISFPMICLRNYSLNRISRIMVRSIRTYLKKNRRNRSRQHLQIIKIIGFDTKMLFAYMNTLQDTFQDIVKTFCEPRKSNEDYQFDDEQERPNPSLDDREYYLPSFKTDNSGAFHYRRSKDIQMDD
ncbi:hypothetical protein ABPG72_021053 [Tetrahymena utriculariae]